MVAKRKSPPGPRARLNAILASLDDDKAEDVTVISLKGKSTLADHMVVATGRSQRHIVTLAEHLAERLKALGLTRVPIEGRRLGEWVVVDCGDAIVHLFQAEARAHYGIEKMWSLPKPKRKPATEAGDAPARKPTKTPAAPARRAPAATRRKVPRSR